MQNSVMTLIVRVLNVNRNFNGFREHRGSMAPSRPFGRGGFTTLDRRKAAAQSLLARAWSSCVARRCLALRLDEARQEQQRLLLLEQKRAVAERLAAERRATTVTRKKKPQSGLHLQQLFGVLPGSGVLDGDHPGTTLSSPIHSEGSFSTRWLVGDSGLATGPPSRLSTFQGGSRDWSIACEALGVARGCW